MNAKEIYEVLMAIIGLSGLMLLGALLLFFAGIFF